MEPEDYQRLPLKLRFKLINNQWKIAQPETPKPPELEKNVIYFPYEVIKKYTQDSEVLPTALLEEAPPLDQSTYNTTTPSMANQETYIAQSCRKALQSCKSTKTTSPSKLKYRPYNLRRKKRSTNPRFDS